MVVTSPTAGSLLKNAADGGRPLRNQYETVSNEPDNASSRPPPSPIADDESRPGASESDQFIFDTEAPPESFGVGERVSYYSASHNQWLSARVLRPNFDGEGVLRSYDLDVRKRAEASKIRRCLPEFHGDEESVKRRIEAFKPPVRHQLHHSVQSLITRVKRGTSHGDMLWLKRSVKFVAFAMEPFVDAVTGTILAVNGCYLCATVCMLCILAPYLVLCVAYRCPCNRRYRMQMRADCFRKTLGSNPGLLSILSADVSVVLSELRDTTSLQAQNYVTLRHTVSLLESCPWAFWQILIAIQQVFIGVRVISPFWLAISIPQSLFNAITAYSSMTSLGSITQEGDLTAHLESLIRLSIGAAPPMVLERILEERDVVVDEDLKQLNRRGFRSLARAMARSQVAECITFKNTSLDRYVSDCADDTERANLWAHFCCDFCDNHGVLETVNFTPSIAIPRQVWQEVRRFNIPVLGQVWNGSDLVFEREPQEAPMERAVAADDVDALRVALEDSSVDLGKVRIASMYACCFDHWRSLQVLLAHTPANVREPMMLSHAAENGAVSCLKLLLLAKAHADAKGRAGLTALEMAALKGYAGIVNDLLAASANPDMCGSFTPLASVAFSNNGEIARALLKAKANLNHLHRNDSVPLHIAARYRLPRLRPTRRGAARDDHDDVAIEQ